MSEFQIGNQRVRFDRKATVLAYSKVPRGDADRCTCTGCQNFALLRGRIYPDVFRDLLENLGIDQGKEGEAVHYGPSDDLHLYGGWFYFVGELVKAGERRAATGTEFQYWFSNSFPQPPGAFTKPVAAVEFITKLPWILDVPYDPLADTQLVKATDIMGRYKNALRALARGRIDLP